MTGRAASAGTPRILNLGCGLKHVAGAVNLDVTAATNPDVVHDLNVRPWPFPDNAFDEVRANDVIEHLDDIVAVVEEVHRISAARAVIRITVPHFSCANAFTDPTHRHYFGIDSFKYFTGESAFPFYTPVRFRSLTSRIVFSPTIHNKVVWRLANRWPATYERTWAWMFPAWFLGFELEVIKP